MVTRVVIRVVTRSSQVNELYYGLFIFLEFGNVWQGIQK